MRKKWKLIGQSVCLNSVLIFNDFFLVFTIKDNE